MFIREKTVRITGYVVVTAIFFLFFMMEMFFSWKDDFLVEKVFFITLLHTWFLWEPTRFILLTLRKNYSGLAHVKKRLWLATLILVPYAFLVGFLRIYLEDATYIWNFPVAHITSYSYTIGISLLFILLELAVYESLYFFDQWNQAQTEAEELRRLNFQVQIDSLKVQIQPHFLFNTLNTLIGLIEVDGNRAIKFTENLAYVYRYLLHANDLMTVSLQEELHFTRTYFSLLKTRYPDGLFLAESVNLKDAFFIPPLSLHILIENAVKHNNFSSTKPLNIEIRSLDADHAILVSNNLQPKTADDKSGKGLAYLKKRFELLNMPSIKVKKEKDMFSVLLPLIKTYRYEHINN